MDPIYQKCTLGKKTKKGAGEITRHEGEQTQLHVPKLGYCILMRIRKGIKPKALKKVGFEKGLKEEGEMAPCTFSGRQFYAKGEASTKAREQDTFGS